MNNDITRIYDIYQTNIGTIQQREGLQNVEIYDIQTNFNEDVNFIYQKRSNPILNKYNEYINTTPIGIQNITLGNIGIVNIHQKKEYLD